MGFPEVPRRLLIPRQLPRILASTGTTLAAENDDRDDFGHDPDGRQDGRLA